MGTISASFKSKLAPASRESHAEVDCIDQILKRRWLLSRPDTKIQPVLVSYRTESDGAFGHDNLQYSLFAEPNSMDEKRSRTGTFHIIRDDLLHPVMGGNKLRKLDALLPLLQSTSVTDVITCGGCQSAHAAALAVACAENGLRAHLLLRGEKLPIPTGYNLISGMYGQVTYIPRAQYANRKAVLAKHAEFIIGSGSVVWLRDNQSGLDFAMDSYSVGSSKQKDTSSCPCLKKVAVIKEGASDAVALLGLVRLVDYLSQPCCFGRNKKLQLVVDSGTGTTAIGLAVGILILRLPWEVVGVTLAGAVETYKNIGIRLLADLNNLCYKDANTGVLCVELLEKCITWVERRQARKFGKVLEGELQACRRIAQQTGILLDPIFTLAAWEVGSELCLHEKKLGNDQEVVVLHTGGTMGLFGLAQRYPTEF